MPNEAIEAAAIIAAGFIFNIIETGWFGWNLKPTCPEEMICDYISSAMMIGGLIMMEAGIEVNGNKEQSLF